MSNVIPFRSRAPHGTPHVAAQVPLYRLSLAHAKALGICPEPANDIGGDDCRPRSLRWRAIRHFQHLREPADGEIGEARPATARPARPNGATSCGYNRLRDRTCALHGAQRRLRQTAALSPTAPADRTVAR
jgi:hypothetical protein